MEIDKRADLKEKTHILTVAVSASCDTTIEMLNARIAGQEVTEEMWARSNCLHRIVERGLIDQPAALNAAVNFDGICARIDPLS